MADPDKKILEFGTGAGHSTRIIDAARRDTQAFYSFDSFEGLPEDWVMGEKILAKGSFSQNGKIPDISGVTFVKGDFAQSIPSHRDLNTSTIGFLSIDCDLYASCKTILDLLNDLIVDGTVIYFDEICDWGKGIDRYPCWPEGEYKAFCEWILDRGRSVEAVGRNDRYGAAVRVLR
jgi:predicted O-methyltransferase YrrM